jgi:hypothetical protein
VTTTFKTAEECVVSLIAETNRSYAESDAAPWGYELTPEVHNIGVVVTENTKTLRVNPCWLRFVVQSGDFKTCVADEIVAWHLIQELTNSF